MNYKIFFVVWFSVAFMTASVFSQTGYVPSAPATPPSTPNSPYYSNGQIVSPASGGTGQNSVSGMPRVNAPTVPNSGFTVPNSNIQHPQGGPYNVPRSQPNQAAPSQQQRAPYGSQTPAYQSQVNAPFELNPQQQEQVNRVLAFWESYTSRIKKFEADFDLYSYPAVSVGGTDVNAPPKVEQTKGFLKYEAPNKGIFRIDGPPKELYRCNGKSVYTYNFDKKEINEYKYSDGNSSGQELKKGPMAFLFGASAATLRDRYWIRLLPLPPGAPQGQIWLEAYPKYQEDLQDMTKAELIINVKPCKPVAFQRYAPNGDRQSYALKNIKVNKFELFGGEPFEPNERGWTIVTSSQSE